MSEKPVREHDKFMLRLPDGVREMLKLQADQNKRSLNSEIVARLLETLEPWKPGDELTVYEQAEIKRHDLGTYDIDDLLGRLEKISNNFATRKADKGK